jgi:hypothetical protein
MNGSLICARDFLDLACVLKAAMAEAKLTTAAAPPFSDKQRSA